MANQHKPVGLYRIIKSDPLNWVIERYQEGGEAISRGRYAGQAKKAAWKPIGYYPHLKAAALALLDKEVGEGWTGTNLRDTILEAEKRVLQALPNEAP